MPLRKRIILYLATFILTVGACILFVTVFGFEKNTFERKSIMEINDDLIQELYNYIPTYSDNHTTGFYSDSYINYNNLSSNSILRMIYKYISYNNNLSKTTTDELDALAIKDYDRNYQAYKISIDDYEHAISYIYGDNIKEVTYADYVIDEITKAKLSNNTFYIYNVVDDSNYVTYRGIVNYSTHNNNDIIKIVDYFLKCDKVTGKCYNDATLKHENYKIVYNDNLKLDDNTNGLQFYEHTFIKNNNRYIWESSKKEK